MNKPLLSALATASLATFAAAQAQDVGLTLDGGVATVIYGQACGPVGCTPFPGGPLAAGQTRILTQYSAPSTLYAVAIGTPGPCVQVPGFENDLLLANPFVIDWGVMPSPPFNPIPCQQTFLSVSLAIPAGAPPGIVVRLQSIGVTQLGRLAFGPAIECTVQ